MTYLFAALALIFFILLSFSVYRNLQFAAKLDELGEQVDESLDLLNECYRRIAKAAEVPVMSDEPIVRELVNDIRLARDAVLLIANKLVVFDTVDDEDSKE